MSNDIARSDTETFDGRLEELARIRSFIEQQCRRFGVPERTAWALVIACDEICSNIIRHGYRLQPGGRIRVCVHCDDIGCTVELRDTSPPFDPTRSIEHNRIQLTVGGHGLYLANRAAAITYVPADAPDKENLTRIAVTFDR